MDHTPTFLFWGLFPFLPPFVFYFFSLTTIFIWHSGKDLTMQEIQEMWVPSLDWEDPLEQEMATHCSVSAWEFPWTEEPGGHQSIGSQSQACLSNYSHAHTHDHQPFCYHCYCFHVA